MTTEESTVTSPPRLPRGARTEELSRVPVRQRLGMLTLSAWRITVSSDEGPGTIVLIENGQEDRFFRGDGVFLGWSPAELATAWEVLLPRSELTEEPSPQLG